MAVRSINQLAWLRSALIATRRRWLAARGIAAHPTSMISLSVRFVLGARGSLSVGRDTQIAVRAMLVTRDPRTGETRPIRIGERCFIGGAATIMPGVTIGDESIVGGGAVVLDDVPARVMVAGNPARIIRRDIQVGRRGRLKGADENSRRTWR